MEQQEIQRIIEQQRTYFQRGEMYPVEARRAALFRVEEYFLEHQQEVLDVLAEDLGKPALEAYLSEYHFLLQEIRFIRGALKSWLAPKRVKSPIYFKPCKSSIEYKPFGVVLVVAPWNYPIQLAISPLIAAVAAGNTVVLKPSEVSAASEQFLVRLVQSCFAPEHVHVVTGGADVSKALLDEKFDFIFFTGSTEIGRMVARKAAEHLTPSILELGGKCPVVVDSSADPETAARRILAGKLFNSGQTCFAPDYVAVHADVEDQLIVEMQKLMKAVPWQEEMGRVINRNHYARLIALIDGCAGEEIRAFEDDEHQLRMAPRILRHVSWDDPIMKEEIFGPLLPVIVYEGESALREHLNAMGSPLALYLFSKDRAWIRRMMDSLRSGGVCINDTMKQGSILELPFGGVGDSGYGRYRGKTGVLAMSYQRSVVERSSRGSGWADLLPPYEKSFKWLKKLLK